MLRRGFLSALRTVFAPLLLAAFLVQAAIPSGYMASRSESGAITVKICGSDGVWLVPIEQDHAPAGDHEKERVDQPCVGGALAKAFTAPDNFALPSPTTALALYEARHGPQIVAARARALPPARGPPAAV